MTVAATFKLKLLRFRFTQFEVEEFNNYDQLVGVLPEHVFVKRLSAIQHVTIYQYPSAMLPHVLGWIILLVCGAMATVTGVSAVHGDSLFPNLALFIAPGLLFGVMVMMHRGKPAKIQKWKESMTSLLDGFSQEDYARYSLRWSLIHEPEETTVRFFIVGSPLCSGWSVVIQDPDDPGDPLPPYSPDTANAINGTVDPPAYASRSNSRSSSRGWLARTTRGTTGVLHEDGPPEYDQQVAEVVVQMESMPTWTEEVPAHQVAMQMEGIPTRAEELLGRLVRPALVTVVEDMDLTDMV
ncbi:hypothetical protein BC937DRAFT_91861 [Endogone sp. FLAS-F59071]|nr:hypothetical protein BC937DRAFT_91861 [Endogone sp. FLAS-F59071]|eukprot:RUS15883.1 hypothetical protein BC937DRAFT_91861 [Endogone sp. FLAS-F59071]